MTTDELDIDPVLERRLRTSLAAVAAAVTADSAPAPSAPGPESPPPGRRPRRLAAAAGLTAGTLSLAAFAYLQSGPEYVAELPPPDVLSSGEVEGVRYWLVPSFHDDVCGRPMAGVEIVSAAANQVGQEWSTGGMAYGDPREGERPGCDRWDETAWLADPSRSAVSWMRLGESDDGPWGGMAAVHPDITQLVVEVDGTPLPPIPTRPREDAPDGPRYGVVGVPEDTDVATITLLDGTGRAVAVHEERLSALGVPAAD